MSEACFSPCFYESQGLATSLQELLPLDAGSQLYYMFSLWSSSPKCRMWCLTDCAAIWSFGAQTTGQDPNQADMHFSGWFNSHHRLIRLLLSLLGVLCPVFPSRELITLDSLFVLTTKPHTGQYYSQLPVVDRFFYLSKLTVYSEEFLGGSVHLPWHLQFRGYSLLLT